MRNRIFTVVLLGSLISLLAVSCAAPATTILTRTATAEVTAVIPLTTTATISQTISLTATVTALPDNSTVGIPASSEALPTLFSPLPAVAPNYRITMDERVFNPIKLTVPAGTEVEFQSLNHTETRIYSDYPFQASVPALKSFYFTFNKPGIYKVWEETLPLDTVIITVTG